MENISNPSFKYKQIAPLTLTVYTNSLLYQLLLLIFLAHPTIIFEYNDPTVTTPSSTYTSL